MQLKVTRECWSSRASDNVGNNSSLSQSVCCMTAITPKSAFCAWVSHGTPMKLGLLMLSSPLEEKLREAIADKRQDWSLNPALFSTCLSYAVYMAQCIACVTSLTP